MSSFEEYYYSNIAKKVRYYRTNSGYSQEYLSELLDMNDKYIGHIERCERKISNKVLAKLLLLLKIQPQEFFKFDETYDF